MDEKTFIAKVQAKQAELQTKNADAIGKATPEEAKAITSEILKKAKSAVKQEERDEALKLILDTIASVAADDVPIMAAVAILRRETRHSTSGVLGGASTRGPSIMDQIFVNVGDTADEAKLFAVAKYGRGDGRRMIQHAVKDAKDAASRKWISFDIDTGVYKLESIGANPPDGWTGYLPVAMATDKAATADAVPTSKGKDKVAEKMF